MVKVWSWFFFLTNQIHWSTKITEVKPCRENISFDTDFFEIHSKTFQQKLKENGSASPSLSGSPAAHQADDMPQFASPYFLVKKVMVREQMSPSAKVKWLPQKGWILSTAALPFCVTRWIIVPRTKNHTDYSLDWFKLSMLNTNALIRQLQNSHKSWSK